MTVEAENHVYTFVRAKDADRALEEGVGFRSDFVSVFADHDGAAVGASKILGKAADFTVLRIALVSAGSTFEVLDQTSPAMMGVFIDELPGTLGYLEGPIDPARLELSEPPSATPGL